MWFGFLAQTNSISEQTLAVKPSSVQGGNLTETGCTLGVVGETKHYEERKGVLEGLVVAKKDETLDSLCTPILASTWKYQKIFHIPPLTVSLF